jgi:hypothetical protein
MILSDWLLFLLLSITYKILRHYFNFCFIKTCFWDDDKFLFKKVLLLIKMYAFVKIIEN